MKTALARLRSSSLDRARTSALVVDAVTPALRGCGMESNIRVSRPVAACCTLLISRIRGSGFDWSSVAEGAVY